MSNAQPIIRPIAPSDFLKVLEINNSSVPSVGELTLEKLHYLVEHSLHALVVEHHTLVGFCITFAPNAPYDSLNYLWFCERYEQFVYLDRIAFVPDAQGMGLGKVLYQHIEHLMDEDNLPYPLCCEVNLEPPNPGSLRFHQSIGFKEVGQIHFRDDYLVGMLSKDSPQIMIQVMNILVTGASGFFGEILCQFLTDSGHAVHGVDILPQRQKTSYGFSQADIRDKFELSKVFASIRPNAVVHAAAILAHERPGEDELWTSNVEGTKIVCKTAIEAGCGSLVFLSSNCLWAEEFDHPVTEAEPPNPIEIYGRSKWEGEKIVQSFNSRMDTTIFRSPTIVSAGRLGLLGILFQFIEEGRRVYIVGGGRNRYQFVYALDYCRAILLALEKQLSGTYNVGSSDVPTMADSYQHVINQADSGARLVHLPRGLTIFLLRILHVLRLSPLGPYQYRMIASSFEFDITKLKHDAGWQPKLTNNDMLLEAYNHYKKNKLITSDQSTSAHNRVARGGILDLVRKLS